MKKFCSFLLAVFVLFAPVNLKAYAVDEGEDRAQATFWENVKEWTADKYGSTKDWLQSTQVYNHNYQNDLERLEEWSHNQYANAKDWFSTTSVYNYDYQKKWKSVKGWFADKKDELFGSQND